MRVLLHLTEIDALVDRGFLKPERRHDQDAVESAILRITPGEWDAFMDDVAQTLDKFAVPAVERAEVVAIVESTRADIVV